MSMTTEVREIPPCDICGVPAVFDAQTKYGPWANLCGLDFVFHAKSQQLGTGKGQRFVLVANEMVAS